MDVYVAYGFIVCGLSDVTFRLESCILATDGLCKGTDSSLTCSRTKNYLHLRFIG
jgi:hypothetical protein